MKLKKDDLIIIKWEDIIQYDDWIAENKASEKALVSCLTVGFYLNETKRWIRLSDTICSDTDRNVTVIPKGCILKIRRIDRIKR